MGELDDRVRKAKCILFLLHLRKKVWKLKYRYRVSNAYVLIESDVHADVKQNVYFIALFWSYFDQLYCFIIY